MDDVGSGGWTMSGLLEGKGHGWRIGKSSWAGGSEPKYSGRMSQLRY